MISGPSCQFARVPALFTSLSNGYTALCITQESATLSRRKLGEIQLIMWGKHDCSYNERNTNQDTKIRFYNWKILDLIKRKEILSIVQENLESGTGCQEILSAAPRFCLRNGSFGFLQQSDEIRKSWFCPAHHCPQLGESVITSRFAVYVIFVTFFVPI